jgi:hypothetical protein
MRDAEGGTGRGPFNKWRRRILPPRDEDYFADMDGSAKLSPEEVKGRNNPPPPSFQVGSYTLLSLRGAYRFWKQQAAVGSLNDWEPVDGLADSEILEQEVSCNSHPLITLAEDFYH